MQADVDGVDYGYLGNSKKGVLKRHVSSLIVFVPEGLSRGSISPSSYR